MNRPKTPYRAGAEAKRWKPGCDCMRTWSAAFRHSQLLSHLRCISFTLLLSQQRLDTWTWLLAGVGYKMDKQLAALGVQTVSQLRSLSAGQLLQQLGERTATFLQAAAWGQVRS